MRHGRRMAIRQERPRSKPAGLLAALCLLGVTRSAGQAARAQEAAPAASLTPGTKVYDQDGQEVGQIVKVSGDKVVVAIDGNGLVVPKDAFMKGKKGPALKAPKAKILAVLKEAEADAAAADGALKPGAEVRSADGAAVPAKVNAVAAQGEIGRAHVCTPVTNANLVCRRTHATQT